MVIGYNTEFDVSFLRSAGVSVNGEIIDVMREDANLRGGARWRILSETATRYGYVFLPHDSLQDCKTDSTKDMFIRKRIGKQTYLIKVRFHEEGKENLQDKFCRMLKDEVRSSNY